MTKFKGFIIFGVRCSAFEGEGCILQKSLKNSQLEHFRLNNNPDPGPDPEFWQNILKMTAEKNVIFF